MNDGLHRSNAEMLTPWREPPPTFSAEDAYGSSLPGRREGLALKAPKPVPLADLTPKRFRRVRPLSLPEGLVPLR